MHHKRTFTEKYESLFEHSSSGCGLRYKDVVVKKTKMHSKMS